MKTKKLKCDRCKNAWRVTCDEDTGCTLLHGCKLPRKQKFSGDAKWIDAPCAGFVDYANTGREAAARNEVTNG